MNWRPTVSDRFTPAVLATARKLNLPREFREGDWVTSRGRFDVIGRWSEWAEPYLIDRTVIPIANKGTEGVEWVWLPLEGDCFDLLREAGLEWELTSDGGGFARAWRENDQVAMCSGATPLEALYALLVECGIGGKGEAVKTGPTEGSK